MKPKALYWLNNTWASLEVENAEKLNNLNSTDFASHNHKHSNATTSQDGFMSFKDKIKLDGIDNKVTVDGQSVNVNFIENKVIQEGLVYADRYAYTTSTKLAINKPSQQYEIVFNVRLNSPSTSKWLLSESNGEFRIGITSTGQLHLQRRTSSSTGTTKIQIGTDYNIIIRLLGNHVYAFLNGKQECYINYTDKEPSIANLWALGFWDGSVGADATLKDLQIYNRELSYQEFQHNLSVLNNTPAINKINDYVISSNTDHITTRTGHTEEERYTALLSKLGKEFTSKGEDILVENGIEKQRVLGAKIEGQTVKNEIFDYAKGKIDTNIAIDNDYKINQTGAYGKFSASCANLIIGKTYTLFMEIIENNITVDCGAGGYQYFSIKPKVGDIGIFKQAKTIVDNTPLHINYVHNINREKLVYRYWIIEGDHTNTTKYDKFIPQGLNSTKAIISNNGLKYSFYATEEDKAQGKVIELGGIGGVYDTLEIKEDGSGVWTQNTKSMSPTETIALNIVKFQISSSNSCRFALSTVNVAKSLNNASVMCNVKKSLSYADLYKTGSDGVSAHNSSSQINFTGSDINDLDVNGFKSWVTTNNVTIRFQLETPIVTNIPKELMPPILTQATNKFTFGDAVKPSSVEITVPVDKIGELTSKFDNLNSLLVKLQLQLDTHEGQL